MQIIIVIKEYAQFLWPMEAAAFDKALEPYGKKVVNDRRSKTADKRDQEGPYLLARLEQIHPGRIPSPVTLH